MSCRKWVVAAAVMFSLAAGCDRDSSPKHSEPNPNPPPHAPAATQPQASATEPATAPAETKPAVSTLTIDGQEYAFPPAKLTVTHDGQTVVARLYTLDPKEAINNDYRGNRYYLPMPLDIKSPQQITGAEWQFRAVSNEFANNDHGVFREGDQFIYQPQNVVVTFGGDMLFARIEIKGQFLEFSTHNANPRSVLITGTLLAPIEYKE
jgi:hypothetical protein